MYLLGKALYHWGITYPLGKALYLQISSSRSIVLNSVLHLQRFGIPPFCEDRDGFSWAVVGLCLPAQTALFVRFRGRFLDRRVGC